MSNQQSFFFIENSDFYYFLFFIIMDLHYYNYAKAYFIYFKIFILVVFLSPNLVLNFVIFILVISFQIKVVHYLLFNIKEKYFQLVVLFYSKSIIISACFKNFYLNFFIIQEFVIFIEFQVQVIQDHLYLFELLFFLITIFWNSFL